MTHTLRFAARTDRGLLRANNQDSVFAGNRLLVVADGMGGHVAGDTASRLTVAAFAPLDNYDPQGRDLLTPLEHATEDASEAIVDMITEDPELDGMGTTVTALMFDGKRVGVAHVGDSRAYLWRGGVLSQITHDDTFVQSLIDEGRITEAEAAHHPQRSLLLRALTGNDIEPSLSLREVRVGDRYLLCSDGLSGVISAEAIADTLASYDTDEAADRLIELALRGGGPDNVTVIVADVLDTGEAAALDDEPYEPPDTDATGPIDEMRFTRRMPRVPLPPEPARPDPTLTEPELLTAPVSAAGDPDGNDEDDELDDEDDDELDDDARDDHGSRSAPGPARRWLRRIGLLVAIFGLLVIGGVLGVNWVGNQYYVGDAAGEVTVFRGVDGSVLGMDLFSAQEGSCLGRPDGCVPLRTADLVPAARDQVLSGIPAGDLSNARDIIDRLGGQLLPLCTDLAVTTTTTRTTTTPPAGQSATSETATAQTGTTTRTTDSASILSDTVSATDATPTIPAADRSTVTDGATAVSGGRLPGASDSTFSDSAASSSPTSPAASSQETIPQTTASTPGTTLTSATPIPGTNCRTGS